MDILTFIIILLVIAFAFYANNTWVEAPFRMIFNVVLMLVVIIIVLHVSGVLGTIGHVRIGK